MNFKRIGRLLVCFVLICALLINVSPIKAHATTVPNFGMFPEEIVVRSVVHALGIYAGENPDFFDGICNAIRDLWDQAGYIVSGCVKSIAAFNGVTYCARDLIEMARDYILEQAIIQYKYPKFREDVYVDPDALALAESAQYGFFSYTLGVSGALAGRYGFVLCYSNESPIKVTYQDSFGNGYKIETVDSSATAYVFSRAGGWDEVKGIIYSQNTSIRLVDSCFIGVADPDEYSTEHDLQLGYVGSPGLALEDAYPSWVPVQFEDEALGTITDYLPLGLGATLDQTLGMTQDQIWAGQIVGELELIQQNQVTQTFLQQLLHQPIQTLGRILEEVISIPGKILGGLGQILIDVLTYLFVPAQDFLQLKIQALVQEFGYLEPIISLGDTFKVYFTGVNPTPPVIWIDLGASAWYPMGGRVKFIDLTWYAQYKPTVDGIIGAFLWLWLLWRLFQSAPGIVRGASGVFGKPDSHPDSSFSTHSE